jgi:hypothetical protein
VIKGFLGVGGEKIGAPSSTGFVDFLGKEEAIMYFDLNNSEVIQSRYAERESVGKVAANPEHVKALVAMMGQKKITRGVLIDALARIAGNECVAAFPKGTKNFGVQRPEDKKPDTGSFMKGPAVR